MSGKGDVRWPEDPDKPQGSYQRNYDRMFWPRRRFPGESGPDDYIYIGRTMKVWVEDEVTFYPNYLDQVFDKMK